MEAVSCLPPLEGAGEDPGHPWAHWSCTASPWLQTRRTRVCGGAQRAREQVPRRLWFKSGPPLRSHAQWHGESVYTQEAGPSNPVTSLQPSEVRSPHNSERTASGLVANGWGGHTSSRRAWSIHLTIITAFYKWPSQGSLGGPLVLPLQKRVKLFSSVPQESALCPQTDGGLPSLSASTGALCLT